jgi:hypothetical protein
MIFGDVITELDILRALALFFPNWKGRWYNDGTE